MFPFCRVTPRGTRNAQSCEQSGLNRSVTNRSRSLKKGNVEKLLDERPPEPSSLTANSRFILKGLVVVKQKTFRVMMLQRFEHFYYYYNQYLVKIIISFLWWSCSSFLDLSLHRFVLYYGTLNSNPSRAVQYVFRTQSKLLCKR